MKKILAVVLTLAMLLSCVAIGTSAVRVATKTETTTTNHYWNFPQGYSWHPVKFTDPTQTFEMDVRLDAENSSLGCYGLSSAPSLTATSVGNTTNTTPYTFTVDKWYNVKWVSDGSNTTIYVDGAEVGTVAGGLTYYSDNQFYFSPVLLSVDNVKNGSQTFDFEGDNSAWNTESTQGQLMAKDNTTVTYTNDNQYEGPIAGDYIYQFTDRSDRYYMAWKVGNMGWSSANYTMFEFDVRADSALAEAGDWLGGAFKMSVPNGTVGIASTISYTWEVGRWYHVALVGYVANGASFVMIDGAYATGDASTSIVSGLPLSNYTSGGYWCGPNNNISYNNFKFSTSADLATWDTVFEEDFNDRSLPNDDGGDAGAQYVLNTAAQSSELGMYYYTFPSGNYYNPVEGISASGYDVEMDISLTDAAANISGWSGLTTGPVITTSSIGVGQELAYATTVPVTLKVGEWYHVKWAKNGDNYDIYVDGSLVGSVAGSMDCYNGDGYYKWNLVSVDNVKIAGLAVMDFETDAANALVGGQGTRMPYDFSYLDKSIPELLGVENNVTTSGTALLMGQTDLQNCNCFYFPSVAAGTKDVVVTFDLAMANWTSDNNEKDSNKTLFDVWLNSGCNIRVKISPEAVGKTTPSGEDVVAYNWGDASLTNFHNITMVVKSSYNSLLIYVDSVLVYEGTMGCAYDWMASGSLGFIGSCYGAAIVANYACYNLDLEPIATGLSNPQVNGGTGVYKTIELSDPCSAWGHTVGAVTTTKAATCYANGTTDVACAYCGEVYTTGSIAKVAHVYNKYSVSTVAEDGRSVVKCQNDGCPEVYYTANYEAGTYTGSYSWNMDFSDKLMYTTDNYTAGGYDQFGKFTIKNGTANYKDGGNCNPIYFDGTNAPSAADFSITMDMVFDGSFASGDADQRGHYQGFWTCGGSGVGVMMGYCITNNTFFVGKRTTALPKDPSSMWKTEEYAINYGEKYTVKYAVTVDDDECTASCVISVNGQVVLSYTEDDNADLYYDFAWNGGTRDNNKISYIYFVDFGTEVTIDTMTFGTSDFALTNVTFAGDADGDGVITATDATYVRAILSGNADTAPCISRADANGDGKITAKDLLIIRKALVA